MSPSRGPRSRQRRRGALLAAAAATLSLVIGTAAPAFAGNGVNISGPGSGGSGNGGNGFGGPGDNSWYCQNGALYHQGDGLVNEAPYQSCLGLPNDEQSKVVDCTVGYDVYRIYGKDEAHPAAFTKSLLNTPSWCDPSVASPTTRYWFPAQTNLDAAQPTPGGTPDAYQQLVDSPSQAANNLPAAVYKSESGLLEPAPPTEKWGTTCDNAQAQISHVNPIEQQWPAATAQQKLAFGAALGYQFTETAYPHMKVLASNPNLATSRGVNYPQTGLATIGIKRLNPATSYWYSTWTPQQQQAGQPPTRNPFGSHYFVGAGMTWDNRSCEGPYNFGSVTDSSSPKNPVKIPGAVFGTCVVPLVRLAIPVKDGGYKWLALARGMGYGLRYSNFYAPKQPGDSPNNQAVPAWRAAIVAHESAAIAANGNSAVRASDGQQVFPAAAIQVPAGMHGDQVPYYMFNHGAPWNKAAALASLSQDMYCFKGTQSVVSMPLSPAKVPNPALKVSVSTDSVWQSGGQPYQATITVSPGTMTCGGGACPAGVRLKSVSYQPPSLTGTNGYTACIGNLSFPACSFKVVSTTGGGTVPLVMTVEFYNATQANQVVRFVLTGLKAQYTYSATTTVSMTGYNPVTGGVYNTPTISLPTDINGTFTPTAVATPGTPAMSGSGAGPYTIQQKVIGAVNTPGGN